ncbi:MAG: hypothetical protein LBB88_04115 [Planctomycetaceae bacterium]|nr:hypothetical protein [Planctomycetaceae bacterium]
MLWIFSIWISIIFGTNNPETIDRVTLIRQIQLRDFRQLSPKMLDRITNRVELEFGIDSKEKPKFEFSPTVKRIILLFQNHDPTKLPPPSEQLSRCERNLQIIAKVRFFQWMEMVESTKTNETRKSKAERDAVMEKIIAELKYWDSVYRQFLEAINLPQPTIQEALEQMENLVNEFKRNESPEQIERIENFKCELIARCTQQEIKKAVKEITNAFDIFFKPQPKKK